MIWNMSQWNSESPHRRSSWNLLDCPEELDDEKLQFLDYLAGIVSVARGFHDWRGWGSQGVYTEPMGYRVFSAIPSAVNNSIRWKLMWEMPNLPKIDMFC